MVATLFLIADLILPVAGHVRSATTEFRTTVWVTNVSSGPANVRATFLERHPITAPAVPVDIAVAAHETKEIDDLPTRLGRDGVVGAIRFESSEPIAVSARIFANGAGGDGLHAVSATDALAKDDAGLINGVTYTGDDARETTYFVETSGRPAQVFVELRDASGRTVAHASFLLEPFEHRALRTAEFAGKNFVQNGAIVVRVPGGSGRVFAIGDERVRGVNDGFFIEMSVQRAHRQVLAPEEIAIYSITALAVIVAALYSLKNRHDRLLS